MFNLDIRTLSLLTMLFSCLFFVGLFVFFRFNKRFRGLEVFASGNILLFFSFLFLSLKGIIPDLIAQILADFFITLAFFFFCYGGFVFLRIYMRFLWLHILGLILVLVSLIYFSFFLQETMISSLFVYTFLFSESVLMAVLFIRQSFGSFKTEKLSILWGLILFALYSLFKIIMTLKEIQTEDFVPLEIVSVLLYICIQILIVNNAFSLIWIVNSTLNSDLETQARLDPLTKMLNRRAFNDEINKELARSKRESLTFSIIMADIDHFKGINNSSGHLAGDSILISFAKIVTDNLRINDVFARYGGEKFLILLPNTEKKYAAETAERIRKVVEINNHHFNGKDINYTVSLGVTAFDIDAQNKDDLFEHVETALYEAKTRGRNRVEIM